MTTETVAKGATPYTGALKRQPPARRRKKRPGTYISRVGVILAGLVFFFPFLWMVATSLKPTSEVFSTGSNFLASRVEWSNYVTAWTAIPFAQVIANSF